MLVASSLTTTVVGVTTQLSASANSTACASTDSSHFTVSTIQDSGPGSLRQALANAEQANGGTICFTPDLGTITFGSGIDYTGTSTVSLALGQRSEYRIVLLRRVKCDCRRMAALFFVHVA